MDGLELMAILHMQQIWYRLSEKNLEINLKSLLPDHRKAILHAAVWKQTLLI